VSSSTSSIRASAVKKTKTTPMRSPPATSKLKASKMAAAWVTAKVDRTISPIRSNTRNSLKASKTTRVIKKIKKKTNRTTKRTKVMMKRKTMTSR